MSLNEDEMPGTNCGALGLVLGLGIGIGIGLGLDACEARNLMRIIINIATNMMRPVKSMKAPGKFSMLES